MSKTDNQSSPLVRIKGAEVRLDGRPVLSRIDWEVAGGGHWFVLGPNGAGKSTLTRLIMGFVWPMFGAEVEVLGNLYGRCDIQEVRKSIAWVSPFLQQWTCEASKALDVVLSGLDSTIGFYRKPTDDERLRAVAAMEPVGCDSLAERQYSHLSSGEQAKVLIARAMITKPRLMILDEPCAHLDIRCREYLLSAIDNLSRHPGGPAIIFVTQRVEDIIPAFENGLVIKKGVIMARGRRGEILTESLLSDVFDTPLRLVSTSSGRIWAIVDEAGRKS